MKPRSIDLRRRGSWAMVSVSGLLVFGVFAWLVVDVALRGWGTFAGGGEGGVAAAVVSFVADSPTSAGREGGIGSILVATLAVLAICMAVAVPLGVGTAAFLSEFVPTGRGLGRWIRLSLDVLAGVPSIVFGLFGNALFCDYLGMGYSLLAGGLTLSCMVLPILIRSVESGFRAVPVEYREAGAALGLSKSRVLWSVVLPTAAPVVATGLILGIGRALAETAALVFTSGTVDRMPESSFDSGRVLSVHIFEMAMNVPGGEQRAYATALTLIVVLWGLNVFGSWLIHRTLGRKVFR